MGSFILVLETTRIFTLKRCEGEKCHSALRKRIFQILNLFKVCKFWARGTWASPFSPGVTKPFPANSKMTTAKVVILRYQQSLLNKQAQNKSKHKQATRYPVTPKRITCQIGWPKLVRKVFWLGSWSCFAKHFNSRQNTRDS